MSELRDQIFEEVYAGRNGDVYEDCYDATDNILALVRDALLSDDAVEAAAKSNAEQDGDEWEYLVKKYPTIADAHRGIARASLTATITAAALTTGADK